MTDTMTTKKPRKKKAPPPFPVERIYQLLAQVQNRDAESIFGETGLAAQLKQMLACPIWLATYSGIAPSSRFEANV